MNEAGDVTPMIDRIYPLHQTSEATAYPEDGFPRGQPVTDPGRGPKPP